MANGNRGDAMRRRLEALGLVVSVTVEEDDTPVRGNAMASGDPQRDRRTEDHIIRRLDDGDAWAWGIVTVEVRDPRTGRTGTDVLGSCSYRDEADFRRCDYWPDMLRNAYAELRSKLDAKANPVPDPEAARVLATLPVEA